MYPLCFRFDGFNSLRPERARRVVQHLVNALVESNRGYLEVYRTPLLYESGIRYRKDDGPIEYQWYDIRAVLTRGYGDCKALAAWRAAETNGSAVVIDTDNRGRHFHVIVRHNNGFLEDPSALLGM